MGREIMTAANSAPRSKSVAALLRHSRIDIAELLYGRAPLGEDALLDDTNMAQQALFCLGYALAESWRDLGIVPDMAIGHSVGEITAHVAAGGLSFEDGAALVAARGRIMQEAEHDGAMIAVLGDADALARLLADLEPPLFVSARNAATVAIVGARATRSKARSSFRDERSLEGRMLRTRHAFHTPFFEAKAAEFEAAIGPLAATPAAIAVAGNVEGAIVRDDLDARYWRRHIVEPVCFAAGVASLVDAGARLFLEIGPNRVLAGLVRRDHPHVRVLASQAGPRHEYATFLSAAAALFEAGRDPRLDRLVPPAGRGSVRLPPRRLARDRYWFERDEAVARHDASELVDPSDRAGGTHPSPGQTGRGAVVARQMAIMEGQIALLERRRVVNLPRITEKGS